MKKLLLKSEGFISSYFIYIFMIIALCFLIIANNINYELKTTHNISKYTEYINNEYIIITYFKDLLENEKEIEDYYFINNHGINVEKSDNGFILSIYGECGEVLEVYVMNNRIYDYVAYRDVEDIFIE